MVDDLKPRYTTKRLRQEIERARENDARHIAALEAQLAERVKVKPLEWLEVPALNGGRKLLAFDLHSREHARLDLKGHTDDEIEYFKARHQQAYDRRILSALETTPPAPEVTEEWVRDTAMDVMLATEVEEAMRILRAALTAALESAPKVTEERTWGEIPSARTDDAHPVNVLAGVLLCAESWVPEARIIGDVRAGDIARAIRAFEPSALATLTATQEAGEP